MANKHRDIDKEQLEEIAFEYCDECIHFKKKYLTKSGKEIEITDRQIPTVDYFLNHWMRRKHSEFHEIMISDRQFYRAMKDEKHPLSQTIKNIRAQFDAIAENIVANEGKGIFYAKNRLGMTDKVHNLNEEVKIRFES